MHSNERRYHCCDPRCPGRPWSPPSQWPHSECGQGHRHDLAPAGAYVNRGPEHMPLGLADRMAHDRSLADRGERDES